MYSNEIVAGLVEQRADDVQALWFQYWRRKVSELSRPKLLLLFLRRGSKANTSRPLLAGIKETFSTKH